MDLREELFDFINEEEQECCEASFGDDDLDVSDACDDKTVLD